MITFRELKPEDLDEIKKNPLDSAVKTYPDFEPGIAFAGEYNGQLVGAGGIRIYWEGVAEAWLMLKEIPEGGKVKLLLLMRKKLDELIKTYNLRRIQATVRVNWPKAIQLIEAFGFEYEGTMRKYAPDGTDMMIYAKITNI